MMKPKVQTNTQSNKTTEPDILLRAALALKEYHNHSDEGFVELIELINQLVEETYRNGSHADPRLRGYEPDIRNETMLLLLNRYLNREPLVKALASGEIGDIMTELKRTTSSAWRVASRAQQRMNQQHAREISIDDAMWNSLTSNKEIESSAFRNLDIDQQINIIYEAVTHAMDSKSVSSRAGEVFLIYLSSGGSLTMSDVACNIGISPQAVSQHLAACRPHIKAHISKLGYS